MTLLRSDRQVALQQLHIALLENADHYRDAAVFVSDTSAESCFEQLAAERESLARDFAAEIRSTEDLPSVPDPEREEGEQFINHLSGLFAADETGKVVAQRLQAEQQLAQMISEQEQWLEAQDEPLLRRCQQLVNDSIERLRAL
ncbi:hypothetical protein KO507_07100 [Gilvimarinus agarilyticus]|uniref:hypothetical protein n=1 Tax=Gilvimarinus sp. 2_MG-2023 TaxID=3062666 RepID=UPI001C09EDC4|nr:hypothetical protein [Gilvimarinus sp. 2_MG-2023]MBU2885525.1 hypothetical protein [Gilvimarinus agarilyticus]MDO6570424.1 hypothetical protein [Gilvimarinus sp. 2_MG-2023]